MYLFIDGEMETLLKQCRWTKPEENNLNIELYGNCPFKHIKHWKKRTECNRV